MMIYPVYVPIGQILGGNAMVVTGEDYEINSFDLGPIVFNGDVDAIFTLPPDWGLFAMYPIFADVSGQPTAAGDPPFAVRFVTLETNYLATSPVQSFPTRPSFTGAAGPPALPQLLPNGSNVQTYACEAAALVAAGAATYS